MVVTAGLGLALTPCETRAPILSCLTASQGEHSPSWHVSPSVSASASLSRDPENGERRYFELAYVDEYEMVEGSGLKSLARCLPQRGLSGAEIFCFLIMSSSSDSISRCEELLRRRRRNAGGAALPHEELDVLRPRPPAPVCIDAEASSSLASVPSSRISPARGG